MTEIFIKGNVPSSKNSQVWTGRFLVSSKTVQKYKKDTKNQWINNKDIFLESIQDITYPIKVSFTFVRGTKHKFDYVNMLQIIQDLMIKYEWIEDDNSDILIPVFGKYKYDKNNPGVIIKVI
jgi:Holliday junction resolvase RusA-like endonuclease